MEKHNNTLTFCAMMVALSVVVMLLGSMLPGMRLTVAALAGVIAVLAVIRGNLGYGVLTVLATAILSFLLLPSKEVALIYAAFFGPYTIVKNLIERIHRQPVEWVLKLLFCGVMTILLLVVSSSLLNLVPAVLAQHTWVLLPIILVVFVLYDIAFSKVIAYLFERIRW